MKRVPMNEDQHRRAKAKAAEMGVTLERWVDGVIEDAVQRPAEELVGVLMGDFKRVRREKERASADSAE